LAGIWAKEGRVNKPKQSIETEDRTR